VRVTRNPLWRRAPFVLLRYPGILGALVGGAALLAVAGAASPLFVSASGGAALGDELDAVTPYGAGLYLAVNDFTDPESIEAPQGTPTLDERTAAFDEGKAEIPDVGTTIVTVLGPAVEASGPGGSAGVRIIARDGALDHVRRVAGDGGEGVWLADATAEELGVEPGDEVRLNDRPVRVAGLYRALYDEETQPYWRSLHNDIFPGPPEFTVPPTFAIADHDTVLSLAKALKIESVDYRWEAPLSTIDLTLPEAEAIARRVSDFGAQLRTPETELNLAFRCIYCYSGTFDFSSSTPNAVKNAQITAATVQAPVDLLAAAGELIALAVLAAVAVFSLARRRVEATLLNARGAGPGLVGSIAALEAFVPVLLGTLLGFAAVYGAVVALGPDARIDEEAVREAATAVAVRAPVALALLALVSAVTFAGEFRAETGGSHRRIAIPWELVSLAVAGWFLVKLLGGDALVAETADVSRPSAYLLLFPVFAIAGVGGLAARGLVRLARAWRTRSRKEGEAAYLAAHRLASARRLVLLLVTACTVALGLFVYAETVVSSYRATVRASSLLNVGSDVKGLTSFTRAAPNDPAIPSTKVTSVAGQLDGRAVKVLAVDPATFAAAVHWEDAYSGRSLDELLQAIDADGDPVPVVLVAGGSAGESLSVERVAIPVRVEGTARAFPGMSRAEPLVVVSTDALVAAYKRAGLRNQLETSSALTQIWAKGDPVAATRMLDDSEARPYPIVTAVEAERRPAVAAFTRTFAFLEALGLVAGLLGVVGLVVYVQARQRTRALAFGLAQRMGLTSREHVGALVLELGLLLLVSFALGVVLAGAAARLVLTRVEPLSTISPVPLFHLPVALLALIGVALAVVAALGAWLAHRGAARANLAEVLRSGG
jgi:putative ABC transport system permease protein